MSHHPKIPEGAEKFGIDEFSSYNPGAGRKLVYSREPAGLSRDILEKKSARLKLGQSGHTDGKKQVRLSEEVYGYEVGRREAGQKESKIISIETLHGESLIGKAKKLLALKKVGEKLKILDIGGGYGAYADQMTEILEQICAEKNIKLEIYTIGLSKQAARLERKRQSLPDLPARYLKWQSISQMSDFPEFDLIIDTHGEYHYGQTYDINNPADAKGASLNFGHYLVLEKVSEYIKQVAHKLNYGGYASIYPGNIIGYFSEYETKQLLDKITAEELQNGIRVRLHMEKNSNDGEVLKIEKEFKA